MQLKYRSSFLWWFPVGIVLAIAPARSTTITTYNDLPDWQAATVTGYQTVDFEGLTPPGTATSYTAPTGLTSSGVEFIGYNSSGSSDLQIIDTSAFSWYNWGTGDAAIQSMNRPGSSSPLPYINIVLPANITSLSMDLFTTSPQALNYSITVA